MTENLEISLFCLYLLNSVIKTISLNHEMELWINSYTWSMDLIWNQLSSFFRPKLFYEYQIYFSKSAYPNSSEHYTNSKNHKMIKSILHNLHIQLEQNIKHKFKNITQENYQIKFAYKWLLLVNHVINIDNLMWISHQLPPFFFKWFFGKCNDY